MELIWSQSCSRKLVPVRISITDLTRDLVFYHTWVCTHGEIFYLLCCFLVHVWLVIPALQFPSLGERYSCFTQHLKPCREHQGWIQWLQVIECLLQSSCLDYPNSPNLYPHQLYHHPSNTLPHKAPSPWTNWCPQVTFFACLVPIVFLPWCLADDY